jgi:hypothetical protein
VADELLNISIKVANGIKSDRIRRIALSTTLAIQKPRIFDKGQNDTGGQIGKYSKKYGEYKTKIGKNPGYVNFRDTDQLMNDFGVIIGSDQYSFGFQNDFNAQKAEWLSEKYGSNPFHVSDQELEVFVNVLTDELSKSI